MKYGQNSGTQDSHPAVHMNPNNWTKEQVSVVVAEIMDKQTVLWTLLRASDHLLEVIWKMLKCDFVFAFA